MSHFWLTFVSVASIHLMTVISPGPDFVLVTGTALLQKRRAAVLTAVGVALGILVHITYCILGLAVIIVKTPLLFSIVKYLGAGYLFYLGVKALLLPTFSPEISESTNGSDTQKKSPHALSDWGAIKQGFLCNVLNPKASIFFLGIFSLVIKPDMPFWQQAFYGLWMCVVTFAWFAFLVQLITNTHSRAIVMFIQPFVTKIMGVLLILFGTVILLFSHL